MNTSGNWDKLHATTKSVRLTDGECAAGRESLASFMVLTPRRSAAPKRAMLFGRFTTSIATATAAALSMSGVAFAAEDTLPGDLLYPVKVSVSEEVRGAFIVNAEAQARWETERAARRLAEAGALARRGDLSEERQRRIEMRVRAHVDRVKEAAQELRDTESSDIAAAAVADLEGTLRAHSHLIATISSENSEYASLEESVREEEGIVADERNTNDEAVRNAERFSDRAVEKRRRVAAEKIAKARAALEASEDKEEVNGRLDAADERLLSGDALSSAGEEKAALSAYIDAQRVAQEVAVMAKDFADRRPRASERRKEKKTEGVMPVEMAEEEVREETIEAGDDESKRGRRDLEPRKSFRSRFDR